MKRAFILLASALAVVAICITGGYRLGKNRERRITNSMIEGSLVSNLGALESLRAGDTATAIRELESHVFMSATLLLNQGNAKHAELDVFRSHLLTYRHLYRTNPAEWTPMEQKLEQLLSSSH